MNKDVHRVEEEEYSNRDRFSSPMEQFSWQNNRVEDLERDK